jgi:GntR family transcriptional repressor for pyruvate dehydrogenase complex
MRPSLSRVRGQRAFEAVVAELAEAIRTGEFHRGDRFPSERVLADELEVSRPTLREAIRVLADAGVVEVRPGAAGGTFVVSEVIPPELYERLQVRVSAIPAVLEARRLFEPEVAKLAAVNGTEADFDSMQRIVDLQYAAGDDWPRVTQLDTRFHQELARATHNPVIVAMMAALSRQLEIARSTRVARPITPAEAIAVNQRTLDAVRARDLRRVAREMDRHLALLEQTWRESSR